MALSRLQREIISRAALAVLIAALLYGGYRCLRTAWVLESEPRGLMGTSGRNRATGSSFPYLAGGVLVALGTPLAIATVTPTRVFERFMGPPDVQGPGENDLLTGWRKGDSARRRRRDRDGWW